MKKLILMGRVAAGKTTLTQALRGEQLHYCKTQYINYMDTIIDTPGEYTELRQTSGALALYAYEADVVGLVLSANEEENVITFWYVKDAQHAPVLVKYYLQNPDGASYNTTNPYLTTTDLDGDGEPDDME